MLIRSQSPDEIELLQLMWTLEALRASGKMVGVGNLGRVPVFYGAEGHLEVLLKGKMRWRMPPELREHQMHSSWPRRGAFLGSDIIDTVLNTYLVGSKSRILVSL